MAMIANATQPLAEIRTGFRQHLRQATSTAHQRVDDLISGIDITTADGLACFIHIHLNCFSSLCASGVVRGRAEVLAALRADHETMGVEPNFSVHSEITAIDPLALTYLIQGSRLGARVMRKTWLTSTDATVCKAGAFFDLPANSTDWQQTCAELDTVPIPSIRAARVVTDALRAFAIFEVAALMALHGRPA